MIDFTTVLQGITDVSSNNNYTSLLNSTFDINSIFSTADSGNNSSKNANETGLNNNFINYFQNLIKLSLSILNQTLKKSESTNVSETKNASAAAETAEENTEESDPEVTKILDSTESKEKQVESLTTYLKNKIMNDSRLTIDKKAYLTNIWGNLFNAYRNAGEETEITPRNYSADEKLKALLNFSNNYESIIAIYQQENKYYGPNQSTEQAIECVNDKIDKYEEVIDIVCADNPDLLKFNKDFCSNWRTSEAAQIIEYRQSRKSN